MVITLFLTLRFLLLKFLKALASAGDFISTTSFKNNFMKKNILPAIALLLISTCANSQIKLGLKAGTNFCFITGLNNDYKPRVGINAGVLVKGNISKKIFIQPEILYSIKGYQFPATGFNSEGFTNLNYICIPFMAGYSITDKLNVLAGPEFNILTKAMSKFDNARHDITKNYNTFEFGAGIGLTYIEVKGFGLELRYSYGISNLSNVILTDLLGNEIMKTGIGHNHTLQLGIIYIFKYK
jgi:hypothetical protein